ncbi:MAG: hypothetical protein R3F39_18320 [Myxococcota bacterium]
MMDDLEEEERELHTLFGALRRQVVRISDGLRSRLDGRLGEDAGRVEPVSHSKVAGGALVEILNLLTRWMGGRGDESGHSPPSKKPDRIEEKGD